MLLLMICGKKERMASESLSAICSWKSGGSSAESDTAVISESGISSTAGGSWAMSGKTDKRTIIIMNGQIYLLDSVADRDLNLRLMSSLPFPALILSAVPEVER